MTVCSSLPDAIQVLETKQAAADIQTEGEVADISFREYEHHFGKGNEGEKVGYVFYF